MHTKDIVPTEELLSQWHLRPLSEKYALRAQRVMPAGVNSPVRTGLSAGINPVIIKGGKGDTIWDVDGNIFIDYCCSWGSLILGHAPEIVMEKVIERARLGSSFGITSPEEILLAEEIVKLIPSIEKIRFVSSGTEATMSALRLARGYTGREHIVKFNGNYHGHSDSLLVKSGSHATDLEGESFSLGVPPSVAAKTYSLPYNDTAFCEDFLLRHKNEIAAIILEPVAGNMGLVAANKDFIEMLRAVCTKIGAVLIFDEVISGFRFNLEGAFGLYGVHPDITCLGKIIGGGFPAAAFGGGAKIMSHLAPEGGVYQAGTLSGSPVAMAAGFATLQVLQEEGVYEKLEAKRRLITDPLKEAIKEKGLNAYVSEMGSLFTLFFGVSEVSCQEDLHCLDKERFKECYKFLFERGVYLSPSPYEAHFVSLAHLKENLEKTADLLIEYIKSI